MAKWVNTSNVYHVPGKATKVETFDEHGNFVGVTIQREVYPVYSWNTGYVQHDFYVHDCVGDYCIAAYDLLEPENGHDFVVEITHEFDDHPPLNVARVTFATKESAEEAYKRTVEWWQNKGWLEEGGVVV